jgi:hypothetical protein
MKSPLGNLGSVGYIFLLFVTAVSTAAVQDTFAPLTTPGVSLKQYHEMKRTASTCDDVVCVAPATCAGPIAGFGQCCNVSVAEAPVLDIRC